MKIKRLVSLIVSVCIILSVVFLFNSCNEDTSTAMSTDSVDDTTMAQDKDADSTDDNWVLEVVDTTVEDSSLVYKTTKSSVGDGSSLAELVIYCFKNDVEQWTYKTQFSAAGLDGTNNIVFDEEKVYLAINKHYLASKNVYSTTIALDKKTGEEVWSVNNTGFLDILLDDENIYVSNGKMGICILSKDGEQKAVKQADIGETLSGVGAGLHFIDENTIAMVNDFGRCDFDVSAYKSRDTISEKIYKCLPVTITASSTLKPDADKTYEAKNLTDRNHATVWSEGEAGLGEGTMLTVNLDKPSNISTIYIRTGHCGSKELYEKNGKPITVEISFNNGTESYKENLNNSFGLWSVIAVNAKDCSSFTIKILEAETGAEYNDVCISDIEVYSQFM